MSFHANKSISSGIDTGITNGERAAQAERACNAWRGSDPMDNPNEINVQDLLTDLMHLCDREALDFNQLLQNAQSNYRDEK